MNVWHALEQNAIYHVKDDYWNHLASCIDTENDHFSFVWLLYWTRHITKYWYQDRSMV